MEQKAHKSNNKFEMMAHGNDRWVNSIQSGAF